MHKHQNSLVADGQGPTFTGLRVLVVDDNYDLALTYAMLLKSVGHQARVAYDGPGGLEIAREFRPEVALLDIGLPGMDGYELARRLREEHGLGLWLVAISAYGHDEHRCKASLAGFDRVLVKPADFEQVRATFPAPRASNRHHEGA